MSAKEWMAGFSTGESNFFITVQKSKTKSDIATSLRFSIAQDSRDILLLKSLAGFFNCGHIAQYKNRKVCEFIVTKINDIILYIIPFFDQYPLLGSKAKDCADFKQVALLIEKKAHLTPEGLEEIQKIKAGMNKARGED